MQELCSVIIPSYNHEKFIVDCIKSIHDQSYENIELILIDDCSGDKTFEVASELLASSSMKKRFKRIVLEKKDKNLGAHDSINMGLNLSKGEFISIINSDDMYHKDRIGIMVKEMKAHNADFAFSLVDFFYEHLHQDNIPNYLIPGYLYFLPLKQLSMAKLFPSIGFALLKENIAISTGNFIFTRRLLDKVGGFISLKGCHDWDFILRSTLYTEPLLVKKVLYYYRLHETNAVRSVHYLANTEIEILRRRFFRAVNMMKPPNPLCPSPQNWPGFFEWFLKKNNLWSYWVREAGEKESYWRVYDKDEEASAGFVSVVRDLYEKLKEFKVKGTKA